MLGMAQMVGHLGFKGTLHQPLGEQLEQAVLTDEVFGFFLVSLQAEKPVLMRVFGLPLPILFITASYA